MPHSHDHAEVAPSVARRLHSLAALAFVVVLVLLLFSWPGRADVGTADLGGATTSAVVRLIEDCPVDQQVDGSSCLLVRVEPLEGEDQGKLFELPPIYNDAAGFAVGEKIVVDQVANEDAPFRYTFVDRDRKLLLWVLAAVFAVAVVLLGGLRGLRAIGGLLASIGVLGFYTMPAIIEGRPPVLVACLTAGLITFAALYLAHGFSAMTSVAVLGTLAALVITVLFGAAFIELARFSGFASEESFFIQAVAGEVDLHGLLLAGLVIGALGAIDDMTVTQASVVLELRSTNPTLPARALFSSAMRVGRDHVASTVNTLFLAYAGASMPLLVLFVVGDLPISDVMNSEIVATEIVRTLVGSLGLVASVPITTLLGVVAVTRKPQAHHEPTGRPPRRRDPSTHVPHAPAEGERPPRRSLGEKLRASLDD
ncbi:MAG: YibE/F family protein [Actinomycetota bacterium]|nr:YibE/F family protein [Actinomycetota bacterium]